MYIITRRIHDYLESQQLKKPELAVLPGYNNKNQALRKLEGFAEKGVRIVTSEICWLTPPEWTRMPWTLSCANAGRRYRRTIYITKIPDR